MPVKSKSATSDGISGLSLLEVLDGASTESGIHLKSTTLFDPGDGDEWIKLDALYRHVTEIRKLAKPTAETREQGQFLMLAASILNSAVTHGRFAFVLTRGETLSLVRADKNWRRRKIKFSIKNEGDWWGKCTAFLVRIGYLEHLVEGGSRRGDGYTLGHQTVWLLGLAYGTTNLDDVQPSLSDQAAEVIRHVQKKKRSTNDHADVIPPKRSDEFEKPKYRPYVPDLEAMKLINETFKFGPGDDDDIL